MATSFDKFPSAFQQLGISIVQHLIDQGFTITLPTKGGSTPPVVVPPVVVPTNDLFTANSITPATDVSLLSIGLYKKSDNSLVRVLQTPITPRKAGVPYPVKWDGRETPTGPVVADKTQYTVKALLSRVTSQDDYGVGNTSDTNSVGVLGCFAQLRMVMQSATHTYIVPRFNEFKPAFMRSLNGTQSWTEVPQADWYAIRDINDIGDLHYFEGWEALAEDSTYVYGALVHNAQDQKFSTGIARFRKDTLAWAKFTNTTTLYFGLSAPYNKQARPGILSARQNTALQIDIDNYRDGSNNPYSEAEKITRKRALAAQTEITGFAVNAQYIAVARGGINEICIYANSTAETLLATITTVIKPGALSFDAAGRLWAVTNRGAKGYTFANNTLTEYRTLPLPALDALYLACTRTGDRIAVKRGGTSQQTIDFDSNGNVLKTWWDAGGHTTGNIKCSLTKLWNVCLSPLSIDAIDRTPFGGEVGSITFAADGSRWETDSGNSRVLKYDAAGVYAGQIAHIDDRLTACVNGTDRTDWTISNLGFYAWTDAMTGGDPYLKPAGQRPWELRYNYLSGLDPAKFSQPLDMYTHPSGRTYLRMVDYNLNAGGRSYARMYERTAAGTLRDCGTANYTDVYGNGLQDVTMDVDGTLRKSIQGATSFQVEERALASIDSNGNPVYAAATLTPPTPIGSADPTAPFPSKPYGSTTRIKKTKQAELVIAQMGQRPSLTGAKHIGLLNRATGKYRVQTWPGSTIVGLSGRGYYPETAQAYGGTDGANVDTDGDWIEAGFNGQRQSDSDNSRFVYHAPTGLFAHEWAQGSLNGGGSINQSAGSEGNIMTNLFVMLSPNVARGAYTGESDASMLHFRRYTGFADSTVGTFNGADVFSATANVYGRNIFNVNDPGVTAGVLIRSDFGGAQGGTGGFTGTLNFINVSQGAGVYTSNKDLPNSAWYSAASEASWLHLSFKDTKGVRPAGANFLRVSLDSDPTKLMILEGELLPEDGSIIAYTPAGSTPTSQTPTASKSAPVTGDNILNLALGTTADTYVQENNQGLLGAAPGFTSSGKLPVTPGQPYSSNYDLTHSVWLKPDGTYLAAFGGTTTSTAPTGAAFLQISSNAPFVNSGTQPGVMVVLGPLTAVPTSYVPYWATLLS